MHVCWHSYVIDPSISIAVAPYFSPQMFEFIFHSIRFILSRWHCVVHGNVHIDAIRQSSILYTVNLFRSFWSSCAKVFSHESLMIVDRRHENAVWKKWIHRSFLFSRSICCCWLENGLFFQVQMDVGWAILPICKRGKKSKRIYLV